MKNNINNIKLGAFVLTSLVLLIFALYFIGAKRNAFSNNYEIVAKFYNVNGLMVGNEVRYAGITVGTVKKLEITYDTLVEVTLILDEDACKFIHKNAIATIGTDGLMGNKIVNINPGSSSFSTVKNGDEIMTTKPIETNEVMHTLNTTNENIKEITDDLRKITHRLNNNNTLWSLLADTTMVNDLKQTMVSIKFTGDRTAIIAGDLGEIIKGIKSGKGSIGAILTDTSLGNNLKQAAVKINVLSDKIAVITGDLSNISKKVSKGEGTIGTLLMDTSFVHKLNNSMRNLENGTSGFNDNMEALKHSFLLRGYFKKKELKK